MPDTSQGASRVSIIGTVNHPTKGTFNIFYNVETGRYGASKRTDLQRCTWPTLSDALWAKGL